MKALNVAVLIVGGLAFAFIVIGFFSPAWIVFEFDLYGTHYHGDIGLFFTRVCYNEAGEDFCKMKDNADEKFDFTTVEPDIGMAVLFLMIFGGTSCIFGALITCEHVRRQQSTKLTIAFASIGWFVSALLVLVAVGMQAEENEKLKVNFNKATDAMRGFETDEVHVESFFKVGFPWAVLMSGLGALFAVVDCVLMAVVYCLFTSPEPVVGQWHQFQNTVVVQSNQSQSYGYPGPVGGQGNQFQNMAYPGPVVEQGNQFQNMAYPGPVVEQGNQLHNMA